MNRRKAVDLTLASEPLYAAGAGFQYSNVDYILLGSILEEKTGKAWEQLVRDEILTPMKLTSAGFGAPGTAGAVTEPRGHRANGTTLIPVEPGIFATFKILHTPPVTPGDYAFGWVSQQMKGQRVIWHNGSNTMWYAILAFNAAADKGVVLVTNGSINARGGLDALAFEIVTATSKG